MIGARTLRPRRERLQGRLRDDQRGRAQQVADADVLDAQHGHAGQVAERQRGRGFLGVQHHERRAHRVPIVEQIECLARARLLEDATVEDGDRPALGVQRQRAAQRRALLLAIDLERVGARFWTEGRAAARPDRRAVRARTRAPRALLAPGLGAAAGDHAARFRGRRPPPAGSLLGADALVDQRARETRAEGPVVQLDLLARTEHGSIRHRCAPPPRRRMGPGPSRARAAGCAADRRRRPRGLAG